MNGRRGLAWFDEVELRTCEERGWRLSVVRMNQNGAKASSDLLISIRARKEDHGHSQQIVMRNAAGIWWFRLENDLIPSYLRIHSGEEAGFRKHAAMEALR